MKSLQPFSTEEDLLELSKQGYFTIMLDENLRVLESALEDDGFKVIVPHPGLKDEALKRQARGWAILTKNSRDFIDEAVRYDYDVTGIEDVKFENETVRKSSSAVRRSQLGTRKGNFLLKVRDNGSFHLQQLA